MGRVLIIGGGIAGSALALALHKAGLDTAIYEAHPVSSRDAGAFLTLASNGMRALQQIDAGTLVAEAADIVQAAHQIMVTNAYDLSHVRRWHRNRMIIIGDAAHAAAPATGQGASMALEDAVILAKTLRDHQSLRDHCDRDRAFASYEHLRRDRVQANIAASARMSRPSSQDSAPRRASSPPGAVDTALAAQLDWNTPMV